VPTPWRGCRRSGAGPRLSSPRRWRQRTLAKIAQETGRTIPQIALNWLLQRPTVSSVIIGARNEEQLRQNLGALGWTLTPDQMATLDAASSRTAPYPYFPYQRQEGFARLNPAVVASAPVV
jgi:aryl-alcohol dehydrogenase-like predicted oxidoreductase